MVTDFPERLTEACAGGLGGLALWGSHCACAWVKPRRRTARARIELIQANSFRDMDEAPGVENAPPSQRGWAVSVKRNRCLRTCDATVGRRGHASIPVRDARSPTGSPYRRPSKKRVALVIKYDEMSDSPFGSVPARPKVFAFREFFPCCYRWRDAPVSSICRTGP